MVTYLGGEEEGTALETEVHHAIGGGSTIVHPVLSQAARELQGKLVYVAYYYTKGDCVENTHDAIMYAESLIDMGIVPYVPHVSLLWHLVAPRPAEFWYGYDLNILRRCDAMIVMGDADDDSFGVQLEVQACMDWGIPVYRQDEV